MYIKSTLRSSSARAERIYNIVPQRMMSNLNRNVRQTARPVVPELSKTNNVDLNNIKDFNAAESIISKMRQQFRSLDGNTSSGAGASPHSHRGQSPQGLRLNVKSANPQNNNHHRNRNQDHKRHNNQHNASNIQFNMNNNNYNNHRNKNGHQQRSNNRSHDHNNRNNNNMRQNNNTNYNRNHPPTNNSTNLRSPESLALKFSPPKPMTSTRGGTASPRLDDFKSLFTPRTPNKHPNATATILKNSESYLKKAQTREGNPFTFTPQSLSEMLANTRERKDYGKKNVSMRTSTPTSSRGGGQRTTGQHHVSGNQSAWQKGRNKYFNRGNMLNELLVTAEEKIERAVEEANQRKPQWQQQQQLGGKKMDAKLRARRRGDRDTRTIKVQFRQSVGELAKSMGMKKLDVLRTVNSLNDSRLDAFDLIDAEMAELVIAEHEMIPLRVEMDLVEEQEPQVDRSKLPTRPPVVCVLGHVDHGKTTLLDSLQQSSIAAGEAGGITQSMGAFSVPMEYGERDSVTFLDTPGHAAFKSMRARGANSDVTDVIVLVVSATDGVQPQTEEAIRLAQEANIPMVVAVNKCDRDDADPDNVLEELSYHGVITEDLDGDVLSVRISALKNQGMDELKDAIILTSEMSDLRASKEGAARAVVLESSTKQGVGHMLSAVVREGTMNVGDAFVCGLQYGKIKAMYDHRMKKIDTALPSTPVTIVGVDGVHSLDQSIQVYDNIDEARRVISQRQSQELIAAHVEAEESSTMQDASPSNLFRLKRNVGKRREKKILVGRSTAEKDLLEELEENTVNVMLKAEVSGSLEALEDYVNIMADNNVNINLVRSSVGPFQASDFDFAKDANASIISFGVEPSRKNLQLAESMGVEVKSSEIIYHLFDQMREKIIDKMPTKKHVSLQSKAEVRKMFQFTGKKKHLIAGCEVKKGTFKKEHPVRVMRDEEEVFLGPISSLKSFSEDADFITEGSECGIQLEGFLGVEEGDILESVIVTEERAKLDDRFARGYHEQEHVRDRREREMKKQSVEMSGADRTHLARDSSGASLHKVSFSEKVIDVEELTRIPGFAGDQKPKSQQGGFLKKRRM